MSREAWSKLVKEAVKVWERGSGSSEEQRKRRLVGWMQRRGFKWDVTWKVVRSVQGRGEAEEEEEDEDI